MKKVKFGKKEKVLSKEEKTRLAIDILQHGREIKLEAVCDITLSSTYWKYPVRMAQGDTLNLSGQYRYECLKELPKDALRRI